MLKSEISKLRTPSQKQGIQSDHRGDVTDADVRDVRASIRMRKVRLKKFTLLQKNIASLNATRTNFLARLSLG